MRERIIGVDELVPAEYNEYQLPWIFCCNGEIFVLVFPQGE